jgi:hypothetical protein
LSETTDSITVCTASSGTEQELATSKVSQRCRHYSLIGSVRSKLGEGLLALSDVLHVSDSTITSRPVDGVSEGSSLPAAFPRSRQAPDSTGSLFVASSGSPAADASFV